MLEDHFLRPRTVDRIRASWIAGAIEQYVAWMEERRYAARSFRSCVTLLVRFGEFARQRGATRWDELPAHVAPFVEHWVARDGKRRDPRRRDLFAKETRGPIEQALRVVLGDGACGARRRQRTFPFQEEAPGFVAHLVDERGLRPRTVEMYGAGLRSLEAYLRRIGVERLASITPAVLSAFVVEHAPHMAFTTTRQFCGIFRVFLRYLHRDGLVATDLAASVDSPQAYRLATLPRSIPWDDVRKVLAAVDRRAPVGRRDYAILLLLMTYGLRGREVAALTLDDVDWKAQRLRVPERKAGHSSAFPLSGVVAEAMIDYLRHGRPETAADRHVFLRMLAPRGPITHAVVSSIARRYLLATGVHAPRLGSHTLRHTCVQRLVDEDFAFKTIGDYVGHRDARSTDIYSKVDVENLRIVALGDGEEVLR